MKKASLCGLCAAFLLCAAALALSCIPVRQAATSDEAALSSSSPQAESSPESIPPADEAAFSGENKETLMPDLDRKSIVNLSVTTTERQFYFHCTDQNTVSVNGQMADTEIFAKLIDQIVSLPVTSLNPFTPEEAPLLTLSISTQDGEITARFFSSGNANTQALIICAIADTSLYRMTDSWRVGTLLLTCDGTRIQDASGQETPM